MVQTLLEMTYTQDVKKQNMLKKLFNHDTQWIQKSLVLVLIKDISSRAMEIYTNPGTWFRVTIQSENSCGFEKVL